MPPDQTATQSYGADSNSSFVGDLLNNAERAAGIYDTIKGGRNSSAPNPSNPAAPENGGKSIADEIAEQLSNLIPDSVVDSAAKQGEARYFESLNNRYNPNGVVGKSALTIGLSVAAFFIAKKLKIF